MKSNNRLRILVACHELSVAGGLYRFERFGRTIGEAGHELAFLALADQPQTGFSSAFPVLGLADAAGVSWDATFIPGAGFPPETVERFSRLKSASFGLRVQHILNDPTRMLDFLRVNRLFEPDVVVVNNRHWTPAQLNEFTAGAIHVLEGAVDFETFRPRRLGADARRRTGFVVGGQAHKNVRPLIEAARLCGDDTHVHLMGPSIVADVEASDLLSSGRLQLYGVLDDIGLLRFYDSVDCVAHTETSAGWANIAAEAMACGVPVVCTPPGTAAFAEHERTALVVQDPTPQALAAAFNRLRSDHELAARLARNAREQIQRFSWPAYSARLLEVIRAGREPGRTVSASSTWK